MTFKEAKKQCRKVGTAHASGDALCAMYADLIAFKWPAIGNPEKFYEYLREMATNDMSISYHAREPLHDHGKALDAMLAQY